ncbi:MAG: hypothetical protein Q8L68_03010, partial [Methylococcales bacterium]|nr:hypothetical protein [Methylococcales bacterium]
MKANRILILVATILFFTPLSAGVEPTIRDTTSEFNGLNATTLNISGLATGNYPNLTVSQKAALWDVMINFSQGNTTYMKLVNATICSGSDKNIWNGSWWNCVADEGGITLGEVNQSADLYNQNAANLSGIINYSVIPALPQANVDGLISDLAGKEPTITGSTSTTFWNGLKQWITLGIENIIGLQTTLDEKLPISTYGTDFPNNTVGTKESTWDAKTNFTININGEPSIFNEVTFIPGSNVSLSQSEHNITISAVGGIASESDPLWATNYSTFLTHVTNATAQITEAQVTGLVADLNAKLNTSTYAGNFPNSTVAANLVNWNATYNATYDAKEP